MTVQQFMSFNEEDVQSIQFFRSSLLADGLYDDYDEDNRRWENFLIEWLNGSINEEVSLNMHLFFDTFKSDFPVFDTYHRGMQVKTGTTLEPRPLASFSLEPEVARFFAGFSETYGYNQCSGEERYILSVNGGEALDLSNLLLTLQERTTHQDMIIALEERLWETEVIAPLTSEMLQLVKPHVFPPEPNKIQKMKKVGEPVMFSPKTGIVLKKDA